MKRLFTLLLILFAFIRAGNAQSSVLISSTGFDNLTGAWNYGAGVGQAFETGGSDMNLYSLSLLLQYDKGNNGSAPGTISIYSADPDTKVINAILTTLDLDANSETEGDVLWGTTSYNVTYKSSTPFTLSKNTIYWIVVNSSWVAGTGTLTANYGSKLPAINTAIFDGNLEDGYWDYASVSTSYEPEVTFIFEVSVTPAITAPTTQATSIQFSSTGTNQTSFSWTNGNGTSRTVFVAAANSGSPSPVDAITYTGNTTFGSGSYLNASGWYCVYNGTGNSVTVTGLSASTTYRAMVAEYNGSTGGEKYLTTTSTGNPANVTTLTPAPTITSFTPTSAGTGMSVTITGTNLSGATAVSFGGTAASSFTINSATQITATVAAGSTGSVSVTTPGGTVSGTGFTFIAEPGIQASGVSFASTTTTQTTVSWYVGMGSKRAAFIAAASTGTPLPVNGTTYTANTTFGSGTQIGSSGWYCIYNGTGTSVTVTGLSAGTTYRVMVDDYNGPAGGEVYKTAAGAGSPANVTTAEAVVNVSVTATSGTAGPSSYATLKDACDKINDGTHKGDITVKIMNNTTETATAVINDSGSGNASYSSVLIYPSGAARTVLANHTQPILGLFGANNITIDGRVDRSGSSKGLTFDYDAAVTSGLPTIMLTGASGNTFRYITVKGSNMESFPASWSGLFNFSFSSGKPSSNNLIEYCDFTASNGKRPVSALNSTGESIASPNSGNQIKSCNFFDIINTDNNFNGLVIGDYNANWNIESNSFYETESLSMSALKTINILVINENNTDNAAESTTAIKDNFIGGTTASCGGNKLEINAAAGMAFKAIYATNGSFTLSGNKISNLALYSPSASGSFSFTGIYHRNTKNLTLSSNIIGSATGTEAIMVSSAAGSSVIGITGEEENAETRVYSGNQIGSIKVISTSAASPKINIFCIYRPYATTIENNIIGSITEANSISAETASSSAMVLAVGIMFDFSSGNLSGNISNNTVANISNGAKANGSANVGVYLKANCNLFDNTIHDLSVSSAAGGLLYGIYINPDSPVTVSGNRVYGLSSLGAASTIKGYGINASNSGANNLTITNNQIYGMKAISDAGQIYGVAMTGAADISNNMISIGDETTAGAAIYGITESGNTNVSYNTIRIAGNVSSASPQTTYCIYSSSTGASSSFRNNILYNSRRYISDSRKNTGIGSGEVRYFTSDYNNYACQYISVSPTETSGLFAWQQASALDAHSVQRIVSFTSATDLHLSGNSMHDPLLRSTPVAGVTTDIDANPRSTLRPLMGADEVPAKFWTGTRSTHWDQSDNWDWGTLPTDTDDIVITDVENLPEVTMTGAECGNLTIETGGIVTILPKYDLTVHGTVSNTPGASGLVIKSDATGSGTYIGPATQATVERYLTEDAWHLVSSPVTAAKSSVYTGSYMKLYNEGTNSFGDLQTSTTIDLTPGTGSAVWATDNKTLSFTGTINTGNIATSAPFTGADKGFTLAGNPYTSAIDWDAAAMAKTGLAASIWVWNGSQYETWNGSTGTSANEGKIAMGQAFFVQATGESASLTATNAAMIIPATAPVFRSAKVQPEQIWLSVTGNNYSDKAVVMIAADALTTTDYRYDALKMQGLEEAPRLATEKDGRSFSIASLSAVDSTTTIPVSLTAGSTGYYTLSMSSTINTGGLYTYLIDKLAGTATRTDLQPQYSFNASTADRTDRFEIVFSSRSVITAVKKTEEIRGEIRIWNSGGKLNIEIPSNEELVNAEIYNLNGTKVKTITSGYLRDIDLNLNTGMYVVRVKTSGQVKTIKVVIM